MLNICESIGRDLVINFNPAMSSCLAIGPKHPHFILPPLQLCNVEINWVDSIKYLGTFIKSSRSFNIDIG